MSVLGDEADLFFLEVRKAVRDARKLGERAVVAIEKMALAQERSTRTGEEGTAMMQEMIPKMLRTMGIEMDPDQLGKLWRQLQDGDTVDEPGGAKP